MIAETQPAVKIYYSAQDCGFVFQAERAAYDAAGTWPKDAIESNEEEWRIYGQQPPPPGMRRGSDARGRPAWITPTVTVEEAAAQERAWRDRQLSGTDNWVVRHRDELEADRQTTLSAEQYQQLQRYRLDLRDWPESDLFPAAASRPLAPDWLADSTD